MSGQLDLSCRDWARDSRGVFLVPTAVVTRPVCAYCGKPAQTDGGGLYAWPACADHADLPGLEPL